MEVCYYCKQPISPTDPTTKNSFENPKILNMYHNSCFEDRKNNYPYVKRKTNKKNSKLFWSILYTCLAIIFIELIVIIVLIILKNV